MAIRAMASISAGSRSGATFRKTGGGGVSDPGPVLANTGLNGLSFQKPVSPGDSVRVRLTCARKTRRTDSYGEVAWNVTLYNQDGEQVAQYELLTMVSYTA